MQISLSWIDISKKVPSFDFDCRYHQALVRFSQFVKIATVAEILFTVIVISIDLPTATVPLAAASSLILLIFFILGRQRFLKLLEKLANDNKRGGSRAQQLVRRSSLAHIITVGIVFVTSVLYGAFYPGYENRVPIGGFNIVVGLLHLTAACGLVVLTVNSAYVRIIFRTMTASTEWKESSKQEEVEKPV